MDSLLSRITITPGLRSGQPCIRDLRITVWDILKWLGTAASHELPGAHRGRHPRRTSVGRFFEGQYRFLPPLRPYVAGSPKVKCRSDKNGLPVLFNFSSRRAVQSQSPQAQGSEPFSSRHLRRSWASCTLTNAKYSSQ